MRQVQHSAEPPYECRIKTCFLLPHTSCFPPSGSSSVRRRRSGGPGSHHERQLVGGSSRHRRSHHVSLLQPVEGVPGEPGQHGAGPQIDWGGGGVDVSHQPRGDGDATLTDFTPPPAAFASCFCSRPSWSLSFSCCLRARRREGEEPVNHVVSMTANNTHTHR